MWYNTLIFFCAFNTWLGSHISSVFDSLNLDFTVSWRWTRLSVRGLWQILAKSQRRVSFWFILLCVSHADSITRTCIQNLEVVRTDVVQLFFFFLLGPSLPPPPPATAWWCPLRRTPPPQTQDGAAYLEIPPTGWYCPFRTPPSPMLPPTQNSSHPHGAAPSEPLPPTRLLLFAILESSTSIYLILIIL